jgi:hypothetical protein
MQRKFKRNVPINGRTYRAFIFLQRYKVGAMGDLVWQNQQIYELMPISIKTLQKWEDPGGSHQTFPKPQESLTIHAITLVPRK